MFDDSTEKLLRLIDLNLEASRLQVLEYIRTHGDTVAKDIVMKGSVSIRVPSGEVTIRRSDLGLEE